MTATTKRRWAGRRFVGSAGAVSAVVMALAPALGAQQSLRVPAEPPYLAAEEAELFRVGSATGPDHETFAEVSRVAFGPDGGLYVLDRPNGRVVVFGPDGAYRHQVGREGEGPGEFRLPTGLAVDGTGRIWVGDLLGGGLEVFDADGSHVSTIPVGTPGARPDLTTLEAFPDGESVLFLDRLGSARNDSIGVHRVTASGEVTTLARVPVPFTPRTEQTGATTFRTIGSPTFTAPTRVVALSGGRFATTYGPLYRVLVGTGSGPAELTVSAPLEPVPVTEAHREEHKERVRERNRELAENPPAAVGGFRMAPTSEDRLEEVLERMRFAETHGVVQALAADRESRIWVQRWGGNPWGPAPIDLVSSDGHYLGTLPPRPMPDAVGPDGRIAYVEEDELGVQRVRVLRVRLPGVSPGPP